MKLFVLSAAAEQDMAAIDRHISANNPDAAVRVLRALREAMRALAEHPAMGHARADLTARPFRFWRVSAYLIIYQPDMSPLPVLRVLHSARDIAALLNE